MKWNLEMIKAELDRLSEIKGDTFSIPVSLNGRLTSTLGRVMGTKNTLTNVCTVEKMEFSKKLLEHGTDEDIERVIKHEWCHYYLMKTTQENHGHNAKFNALAIEMGGNPGTSTVIEGYRDVKSKYETFCTYCGKKTGSYSRAGKVVKETHLYKSGCCGSPLKIEQNW